MNMNKRNRVQENHKLLQSLMILLNIAVLITSAFVGWAAYTAIRNSEELYRMVNGGLFS